MENNNVEKNSNQNKRLGDLLKELVTVQTQNFLISTAISIRKMRNIVAEKLRPFREGYLEDKKITDQVKQYETTIEEMQENYEEGLQEILSAKEQLELDEQEAIHTLSEKMNDRSIANKKFIDLTRQKNELTIQEKNLVARRESLKNAGKKKEAREVQKDIESVREDRMRVEIQVQEAEEKFIECQRAVRQANQAWRIIRKKIEENQRNEREYEEEGMELFQGIKTLDKRKEELSLIPKQNALQKILGWIAHRLSKTEKFSSDLLKGLQNETQRLRQQNAKTEGKKKTAQPSIFETAQWYQTAKNRIIEKVAEERTRQEELKGQRVDPNRKVDLPQPESEEKKKSIEEEVWGYQVIPDEESYL